VPDVNAGSHHRVSEGRTRPFNRCGEDASAACLNVPHNAVLALPIVLHSD
jgi:hypothetical protein